MTPQPQRPRQRGIHARVGRGVFQLPILISAPYRQVLKIPAAMQLTSIGFVWQLPMAIVTLGLMIFIEDKYDSFGVAGLLTGLLVVASAVAAPALSWLIDRYGQALVLRPGLLLHASAMGLMLLLIAQDSSTWALVMCAVLAGLSWPPTEAVVRARWAFLLRHTTSHELHRAFSWESVLDDLISVLGPVLVTGLAFLVSPLLACVVIVTVALLGGLLLLRQTKSAPVPVGPALRQRELRTMRLPGMLTICAAAVGLGATLGALEVVILAFAHSHNQPLATGWLLAAYGISSMISGLIYGAVVWKMSLSYRFAQALFFFALGTLLLVFANNLPLLGLLMVISGATCAPPLIASFSLVQRLMPLAQLTEGIAWLGAALTIGDGLAKAAVGPLIDVVGARSALAAPAVCAVVGLAIGLAGYPRYRSE